MPISKNTTSRQTAATLLRGCGCVWLCVVLVIARAQAAAPVLFNFTLASGQKTSAGVFEADGTLVRTLWSGVDYPAGTNAASWDGTDDWGNLVANGSYSIRVLANACTYTWEGVVGNTSSSWTGTTVWKSYNPIGGLAISGTTAYYGNGYAEAGSTSGKFSLADPQGTKTLILSKGADVWNVATDGTYVYWSGMDPNATANTFVFGTRISDDTEVIFPSGVAYTVLYGFAHKGVIDKRTDGSAVSGLAVQKTGALLFVSHADKNELVVLNKTSGAVVRTITTLTAPGALAVDGDDNIWLVHKSGATSVISQYSAAVDGTLTLIRDAAGAFDTPMALGVSPDNTTLVVADAGASQQLKAFVISTGAASWTFGQAGGYTASVTVSDDRFMFGAHTFVAYQPDGSFWVGDFGNGRIQHYSAAREFIDRVQYRPYSYFCSIDENNPTRLFSDYLEFAIDYSLPLGPANGSWRLVRNWEKVVPAGYGNQYRRFYPNTLSNGKTYALLVRLSDQKLVLFELTAAGTLRDTGIVTTTTNASLQPDGSIRTVNVPPVGGAITWTKAVLTGFDANANPTYAAPATLASTAAAGTDPAWWGDSNHVRAGVQTSGGMVLSFDHNVPNTSSIPRSNGYHFGAVRAGGTKWLWRTSMATHENYAGDWPADGAFDIGNNVRNAGSVPMAVGPHAFYGYYGEFYKGSQVNKFRHYYEDGLFVGEFGVVGADVGGVAGGLQSPAMMAGNAINPWTVKLNDGRVYLYHNDESLHGGVHRWRLDGLDTVAEQTIPITWSAPLVAGLRAEYFDTPDLDVTKLQTVRTDSLVNFNWGAAIPTGTALTAATSYSVRWSGFVTPYFSETYTFYTNSDDGVRLWVNGQLLIDQWSNTGSEQSATIALVAGRRYALKLEYFQNTGNASVGLSWSSGSQVKGLIPQIALSWAQWLVTPLTPGAFDVWSGQNAETSVLDATYGITRNTATDTTTDYWDRWVLRNSKFTYRSALQGKNDVSLFFNNNTNSSRSLSRDLGDVSDATTQWTLSAQLNYTGNTVNQGTAGGQYLEVLDDAGLIIARLYPRQISYPTDLRLTANTANIFQTDQASFYPVVNQWQPLTIAASGGSITFTYGTYAPVTTAVFDGAANWRRPKTLRAYFWSVGVSGGYGRNLAIRDATFSKAPASLTPDFVIGARTVTGGNSNGVIDRNEHNYLTIPVTNQSPAAVENVSVVLSSTTPGVTVLQPAFNYGAMAPAITFSPATTFEIDTAPDIPTGTVLSFTMVFTYTGGTVTKTFTQPALTATLGTGRLDSDSDGIADWWTLQNFGHRNGDVMDLSRAQDFAPGCQVSNLMKFALGMALDDEDIESRVTQGVTTVSGQKYLYLSCKRPEPAITGLTYSIEVSGTLAPNSWTTANTTQVSNTVSGNWRTITMRSTQPIPSTPKLFMRLRVLHP